MTTTRARAQNICNDYKLPSAMPSKGGEPFIDRLEVEILGAYQHGLVQRDSVQRLLSNPRLFHYLRELGRGSVLPGGKLPDDVRLELLELVDALEGVF